MDTEFFAENRVPLTLRTGYPFPLPRLLHFSRFEGKYTASMTDIKYEYDPKNEKKHKDIPAEDVIANGGKGNKVSYIKNPKLFCDATYFFAENLFGDIFNSLDENME